MSPGGKPIAVVHPSSRRNTVSQELTIDQVRKKTSLQKCTFDRQNKCWRGPIKQENPISKWAKAKGACMLLLLKVQNRKQSIDVKSLVKATVRRKMLARRGNAEIEMTRFDESFSGSNLSEKPVIAKPFSIRDRNRIESVWMAPRPLKQAKERSKDFEFEKPKLSTEEKISSGRTSHHATYLKKVIQEKDKEIRTLQRQLMKANAENVKLVQELDGYRGKNYDEIFTENKILRENLQRVSRENVVLIGQARQDDNRLLQRILDQDQADSLPYSNKSTKNRTLTPKPIRS